MESNQKPRILVVDDEPDIALVIKRGLESAGLLVDVFNDPIQALEHFKPDYYDLMLFDNKMPKMTGFQLYREIRKQDSKTHVCFMTAFDIYQKEFEKMFPSYDIKCFIKKPIGIKDLQAMIQKQLNNPDISK